MLSELQCVECEYTIISFETTFDAAYKTADVRKLKAWGGFLKNFNTSKGHMLRKAAQLKAVVVSNIISLYIKSGHFDLKQIVKSDID